MYNPYIDCSCCKQSVDVIATILTMIATNTNIQLMSLAIAFVEGENDDSWY
jgi:hypothetical protein